MRVTYYADLDWAGYIKFSMLCIHVLIHALYVHNYSVCVYVSNVYILIHTYSILRYA